MEIEMQKYAYWTANGLLTIALLGAGGMKLAGVPQVHQSFAALGLPGWFGYFIGACEVAGAIGIWIRPLSAPAAAGIAIITLGALYYHFNYPPLAAGVPALVILVLSIFVFLRNRKEIFAFR